MLGQGGQVVVLTIRMNEQVDELFLDLVARLCGARLHLVRRAKLVQVGFVEAEDVVTNFATVTGRGVEPCESVLAADMSLHDSKVSP